MGLFDLIPPDNKLGQLLMGVRQPLNDIGVGLTRGKTWQKGLREASKYTEEMAPLRAEQAQLQLKAQNEANAKNGTATWLRSQPGGAQFADAIESGAIDGSTAFKAWHDTTKAAAGGEGAPSNVREWEYFNKLDPEAKGQYLRMKRANPYLDIGTGFVQPDPLNPGTPAGPEIVKDNFKPAYDAAAGTAGAKVDVETQTAADSLASKLPGLKTVVGELSQLANTATYTQTGQLIDTIARETGAVPGEAAIARTKYIAMVDNQVLPLLRDTFGAAFTVKEGETLRATLGDPNKAPAEKQAILEAFIAQKVRDLEALRARLPAAGSAPGRTDDIDAILRGYDL